ncbi:hypothetical protein [Streptosporangium sp. NPDC023615]|uniref:hypothetical protein n=1 Tax=Streptosporangium sp. NPDC023615 TaxID=3154794 RepID=UPI003445B784
MSTPTGTGRPAPGPGHEAAWVREHGAHLVDYAASRLESGRVHAAVVSALAAVRAEDAPGNVTVRGRSLAVLRRDRRTRPGHEERYVPGSGPGMPDASLIERVWTIVDPLGTETLRLMYRHALGMEDLSHVLAMPAEEIGRLATRTQDLIETLVSGLDALTHGRRTCPELPPLVESVFPGAFPAGLPGGPPDGHEPSPGIGSEDARTRLLSHMIRCSVCTKPINIRYTVPQMVSHPPVAPLAAEERRRLTDALSGGTLSEGDPYEGAPSGGAPSGDTGAPSGGTPSAEVPPPAPPRARPPRGRSPILSAPPAGGRPPASTLAPRERSSTPAPPGRDGVPASSAMTPPARPSTAGAPTSGAASSGAPASGPSASGAVTPRAAAPRSGASPYPPVASGSPTTPPDTRPPDTRRPDPGLPGTTSPGETPSRTTPSRAASSGTAPSGLPPLPPLPPHRIRPSRPPVAPPPVTGHDTPLYDALLTQAWAREVLAQSEEITGTIPRQAPAPAPEPAPRTEPVVLAGQSSVEMGAPARADDDQIPALRFHTEPDDRPEERNERAVHVLEALSWAGTRIRNTTVKVAIIVVAGTAGTLTGMNFLGPAIGPEEPASSLQSSTSQATRPPPAADAPGRRDGLAARLRVPPVVTLDEFGQGSVILTLSGEPLTWRISAPGLAVSPSTGTLREGVTQVINLRAHRTRNWCGNPATVTAPLTVHGPDDSIGTTVRWRTC